MKIKNLVENLDVHLGAKVNVKGNKGKEPLAVVQIVDDQQVVVKDEYGQKKKVFISDLEKFKK